MKARLVYQSKSAMQSGIAKQGRWIMTIPHDPSWDYGSIMRWPGAHKTLGQICLTFSSEMAARDFAASNNLEVESDPQFHRGFKPKSYASNFTRTPKPRAVS